MNYLITGGLGFIGGHLANKLILNKKNNVIIIDNLSNPSKNVLNKKIKVYYGDASDYNFVKKVIIKNRVRIIYHLSAIINSSILNENQFSDVKTTIISTLNLLKIVKLYPDKKIIFGSSVAVYGASKGKLFKENSICKPIFSYSLCKKTAEDYILYFANYFSLNFVIVRIGNVYGPYQPKIGEVGVINIFIKNLLKKKTLKIFGDGKQKRDFIFIDDAVSFLQKSEKLSGIFNLATGISTSVNSLIKILKNKSKHSLKIKKEKKRKEEIGISKYDVKKAKKTGWRPKYKINNGIYKTLEFYERNRKFL